MIAGAPGIGKSASVKRFCDNLGQQAQYIQAARGEGTAWNFATSMMRLWGGCFGAPKFNSLAEARFIVARNFGAGCILVVDEAQYLDQKNRKTGQVGEAFEWLRATADEGAFKLVFCGDLNLPGAIRKMPQLQSRIRRPVVVTEATRADVAAIVRGTAFEAPAFLDALHAIARKAGGLRNVENIATIAQLFAGDGVPTLAHVKAAIIDMKLAPKGASK
ncbi:AAA family ATPase [Roseovarius dicentrarchi]|uniref:AAA family ATPase n=1 Tax=Roseovarius dicentrarchi TaxID=2250573 RepID=UPI001396712B|nr:AAA family ATPase [Roseovarius dicentrarchi]